MKTNTKKTNKIGILVGGGPAPGINSVIHAAAIEACRHNREVIGIYDGFKHLMEGELVGVPLTPERVAYIYSDGGNKPYRVKINGPSLKNLQALPKLIKGHLIADVAAIIGSLDIVLGEVDR